MIESESLNDLVLTSAVVIHQRHVVGAEVVAVWCWVKRDINV